MRKSRIYEQSGHKIVIDIVYPIDNFQKGSTTPASADIIQARLHATIDGQKFEILEDELSVVQARAASILTDITTTLATHATQLLLVPAFVIALDAAGYEPAQPN